MPTLTQSTLTWDQQLIDIVSLEIPRREVHDKGFMDIIACQYHENTISQIYAYFLTRENNRIISDLFFNALTRLISDKTGGETDLFFDNLTCETEVSTNLGNRIDLVISNPSTEEGKPALHAIIIENKIFSKLNNDLNDYYDSVSAQKKTGVLLTLRPDPQVQVYRRRFINITHREWIDGIRGQGLPSGLTTNQYVYLNDFLNNMTNIIESTTMNNDASFFFHHVSKVNRALETRKAANDFIAAQVGVAAEKLGWKFEGAGQDYRFIWESGVDHLYFTILYGGLLEEERKLTICLEIDRSLLKDLHKLRAAAKAISDSEVKEDNTANSDHAYLVSKSYTLSIQELASLGDFISNKLTQQFMEVYLACKSELGLTTSVIKISI